MFTFGAGLSFTYQASVKYYGLQYDENHLIKGYDA